MSTPFKAAVASFPGQAVVAAAAAARVARAAQGAGRRQAARVVRMWLGLFPSHARDWAANHRPKWLSLKGLFGVSWMVVFFLQQICME